MKFCSYCFVFEKVNSLVFRTRLERCGLMASRRIQIQFKWYDAEVVSRRICMLGLEADWTFEVRLGDGIA